MIKFNYCNCLKDEYLKDGLKLEKVLKCGLEKNIKKTIINSSRDMMGWVNLPYQNSDIVEEIALFGKKISRLYERFVVVGLGGSSLGSKAVYKAVKSQKRNDCKIDFLDNIDPVQFARKLQKYNLKKTMFNVITKSGATIETLSMFAILVDALKKEIGADFFVNIVVTTSKDCPLYAYCIKNNIKVYEIPTDVGGRYSVLTPVGLFPCAVMGVELNKLLQGAKKVLENFKQEQTSKNLCMLSANIMYNTFINEKKQFILLNYGKQLENLCGYYIQLLSESLSKSKTLNGKPNKMAFSTYKAQGVKFQHSILQDFVEGTDDKLFCFLSVNKKQIDVKIPKLKDENLDALLPRSLNELFKTEMIATSLSLKKANKPSFELILTDLTDETLGEFLYYCQLTTAVLGELMQVNAYNQPGVENQKLYTKTLINPKKYAEQFEELSIMTKDKSNYEI